MMLLAAAMPLRGEERAYHIARETVLADTTLTFPALSERPLASIILRAAVHDPARLRRGLSPARLEIGAGEWTLRVQTRVAVDDDIDDGRTIRLSLLKAGSPVLETSCRDLAHPVSGYNTYQLDWTGDSLLVSAGHSTASRRLAVAAIPPSGDCTLTAAGRADVALLLAEGMPPTARERLAGLSPDEVDGAVAAAPSSSPAGYYTYLDREADQATARLGGRYRLAVVPDAASAGSYLILYMSGAEVNPSLWHPGMLKGRLTATPFSGQYDLRWYDAHGNDIPGADDSFAIFEPSARTLTMRFPILEATVRFAAP